MSFSQNITSPLPDANVLFDPVKAIESGQKIQQNQLGLQGQQLDLSNANMQQVNQAAAGLLSAYPDEASRAAAYPKVIGQLQSQGFAMHAPSQYPGEATLRAMVNMGLSPKDLYASGALLTPAQQQALGTNTPPAGGGGAGGGVTIPAYGTGGAGASATVPAEYMPYFQEASQKTGIPVDLLIAQARQESGFRADAKGAAGEIGVFQIKPSTAQSPGGGMAGVDPASITGPANVRNNILFGAQYLRSRMNGDPTNPQVQVQGLAAYNGGGDPNYVQNVFRYRPAPGTATASAAPPAAAPGAATAPPAPNQFAGPGAPPGAAPPAATPAQAPATGDQFDVPAAAAPAQPAQPPLAPAAPAAPAAPSSTSNLPDVSTIPTGRDSPAWQAANQKIIQGNNLVRVAGSNESMLRQGQNLIAQGTAEQQLDHIVQAQQGGRVGEYNTTTGQFTPLTPLPTPRATTDTQGRTWLLRPDGQPPLLLSDNPSGVTGTGTDASAMRIMAELGPKKAQGQTTPQEDADYNNAVIQHLQFKTFTDPATGALMRGPTVPLPPGMPLPDGISLTPVPVSASPRGPNVAEKISTEQGTQDVKNLATDRDAAMKSHDILGTTSTIRSVLPQVTTGTLAEQRLRASQVLTSLGVDPQTVQQWTGTNAAPGEILQKKLFELSTGATRAMGAREPGSVMQMFQKNYPGMTSQNMTIDAMTRLIDMDQTYKEDEVAARGAHLANAVQGVANGQQYSSLNGYTPPDPKLYQAAALATGGMPKSAWAQGLSVPQQTQVLKLSARVYPNAPVLDDKGVPHTFQGQR